LSRTMKAASDVNLFVSRQNDAADTGALSGGHA
jgi:hypothetical protein